MIWKIGLWHSNASIKGEFGLRYTDTSMEFGRNDGINMPRLFEWIELVYIGPATWISTSRCYY